MKNFALLFFFLPILVHAQFTELAPMPESVANNAVVAAEANGNQYVYSFTGIDSTKAWSGIHLKSWRFDVAANEWAALPDVPDPNGGKIAAWASEVKGKIYLIGGYHVEQNGAETSSVKTHVFDPVANDWLPDAANIPVPIDDQVQAVWRDSLIFVVTGWSNNGNVTAVQVFNPAENEWMAGTSVPNQTEYRVFGASGVIIEDTIYYAGGARIGGTFPPAEFFRKGVINPENPAEIEWTGWDTPAARGYRMAAVASGGRAVWLGGSNKTYNFDGIAYNGSGGVSPLDRITVYEPSTNSFYQNTGSMPAVMDLRGLGQIAENQVIIAGGMEEEQKVSNRTWRIGIEEITAVEDFSAENVPIKIFPNPASDWFALETSGQFEFEIYNATGMLVQRGTGYESSKLETEGWESGLYWLDVTLADGRRATVQVSVKKQ